MIAKKIKSVYVLGLGAIGGSYAAKLYDADPGSVKVIADNSRISSLRESGLKINGNIYHFDLITSGDEAPVADLIIIAVKFPSLQNAIEDLKKYIGPHTIVMSLLNGITSEEIIGKEIGMDHLLFSYSYTDAVREGNSIHYIKLGEIVFGERQNETLSARVKAVKTLFEQAGIPCQVPENMLRALWLKFMMNVGINPASALLELPFKVFQHGGYAQQLMLMAAREVVDLSQLHGAHLTYGDLELYVDTIQHLDPEGKTSMLQDIEAGRKTEIDLFAGTVIELGKEFNISTPANQLLYLAIKAKEQYLN
jgi:2-dehydropantoate 2-reductase